eukprot:TRINITY_DN1981_c0_g1_i2.p4 TRINITY_DN1981_c0_g1~~TRINITY_DN1981_c0_g1_i2.p4  ORF type:complete len:110 (-),score=3.13 TRINITY_DN1981_c0_g1_i2:72-401(-)
MVAAPSNLARSGSVCQGYVESGRLYLLLLELLVNFISQVSLPLVSSLVISLVCGLMFFSPLTICFKGLQSVISFSFVQSSIQHAVAYVETVVVCRILWFAVVDFMVCSS